jgi:hypothetical protein
MMDKGHARVHVNGSSSNMHVHGSSNSMHVFACVACAYSLHANHSKVLLCQKFRQLNSQTKKFWLSTF